MRPATEHNRELLVLRYLDAPSRALLGEILQAFDPVCRAHAGRWLRTVGGHPAIGKEDAEQEARIRVIAMLAYYKPQPRGRFEYQLARDLHWHFSKMRDRAVNERKGKAKISQGYA